MARRKPDLVPPAITADELSAARETIRSAEETIRDIDRAEREAVEVIAHASSDNEAERWAEVSAREPIARLTRWQRVKSWIFRPRGGT